MHGIRNQTTGSRSKIVVEGSLAVCDTPRLFGCGSNVVDRVRFVVVKSAGTDVDRDQRVGKKNRKACNSLEPVVFQDDCLHARRPLPVRHVMTDRVYLTERRVDPACSMDDGEASRWLPLYQIDIA